MKIILSIRRNIIRLGNNARITIDLLRETETIKKKRRKKIQHINNSIFMCDNFNGIIIIMDNLLSNSNSNYFLQVNTGTKELRINMWKKKVVWLTSSEQSSKFCNKYIHICMYNIQG